MANFVKFFREVKLEGSKVTWPTRAFTMRATLVVFVMVVIASLFLFTADWLISSAIEWILKAAHS